MERLTLRASATVVAVLLGAALVAWIVTVQRMRGMDAGPGTDLGTLGWYLGVWVTMMAAMMLPSAAPTVLMFARSRGERADRRRSSSATCSPGRATGSLAYAVYRAIRAEAPSFLAWDQHGPVGRRRRARRWPASTS